ncbi:G-type lectin S-receptor-like serine/threonine-protein kinase At2g19130 [Cryptomeria japonica]|uniref:G-type lectin S-receptor-like serine/threonine-protein kinase At2g19130 n=1 Tax=Cryptomeria japonica TaxID=3369 RepID=UPI0027DA4A19|nr:G-type lectin S-receptor-like serine/threonine-protein kinase At2g19130 [Cryptomeria japonica]
MVRRSILVKTCFMYLAFAMVFLEKKCQSVEIVRGDTLPLGASLAGKETLISKNGAFALGFFSPNGTNNWYIGIWFSQIPEKTVVWVANRETPVLSTPSVLNFSRDGRLRLFDSNGRSIWSSNNSLRASRAVMMENGNFIMLGAQNGSEIVWESFRYPGDTLLPGMKMWKGMKLTSWKNSVDPALGPFSFGMDTSPGRTQFLLLSSSDLYWSTGEWINGQFKNMPYHSFQQKFTGLDCKTLSPTQIYCLLIPSGEIMSRVVMAENGVIGRYFLEDNGGWTLIGFTPRDQCNVYNVCGAYAACNAYARSNGYSTSNSHDACRCLDGFRPRDIRAWDSQQWWSSGCVRRRRLQCSASNGTTDGFREVKSTYLADNQAVSFTTTQTLQGCRLECLGNCSCMAFLVTNSTIPICRMWFGDLLNVRETSDGQTVFIRVAASELEDRSESKWGRSHKSIMLRVFLPVTAGALALAFALLLAWIILRKRQKKAPEEEENGVPTSLKMFTFTELRFATKNFKHKLGRGAFGSVFKGTLPDNTHVAVKKLERSAQAEKQFRAEICTIGNIQHVNLVMLRGFCAEGSRRLLVYEYMPNGSLNSLLFRNNEGGGKVLDWKTRFGIALGTARGLVYLHQECRDRIIHCDIKPENILLDGDLCPKIADFGLAKLVVRDFSRVLTTTRGTRGYLAPEWISGLPITPKADVYSFGMTLLEIISGRRNVDLTVQKSSTYYFPPWAATQVHKGNLMAVVDERISQETDGEQVRRAVMTSMLCIQEDENARPSMAQVVQLLEGITEANAQQIQGSVEMLRDHEREEEDSDTSV